MSNILLCPSMMCADFDNLRAEVVALDEAGADIFHLDIMDGQFVPNYGLGPQDIEAIRRNTDKKMDVHLMTVNPDKYIDLFVNLGVDIIYFHPEVDLHPARTLQKIRDKGITAGLAVNPGTDISTIKQLLPLVDNLMVMTVNPGFSGQDYLEFVDSKIEYLLNIQDEYKFDIYVDGAISPDKIYSLGELGVKGFVLGTSSLFGKDQSYANIISEIKSNLNKIVRS